MNSIEAAVSLYPDLQRLIDLKVAGWIFQVQEDGDVITAVKGMRLWRAQRGTWADFLGINNETDSVAVRLTPNKERVWSYEGTMVGAIDRLIELPHPEATTAPRLVLGGPPVSVGRLWQPEQGF